MKSEEQHSSDPQLCAVGCALPEHIYTQAQIVEQLREIWGQTHHNVQRWERLHEAVQVHTRHLVLPLEQYHGLQDFGQANRLFLEKGLALAEQAVTGALTRLDLPAEALDAIFFTTVTGISAPSLDAHLVNRMRLSRHIRRIPMFGLGCVAGASGLSRMADYLRAYPDHIAVLLSVEICSLTFQRGDTSIPHLIASGLFADGAAAVIGVGAKRAISLGLQGPYIRATRSIFYPQTERMMGWEIGSHGFSLVLSASVPDLVRRHLYRDVGMFLSDIGLDQSDIGIWICHTGGPKIIQAVQETLGLHPSDLALTWQSLHRVGNLSSASVLFVLKDTLERGPIVEGTYGILLAMGPGFCSELLCLQWKAIYVKPTDDIVVLHIAQRNVPDDT